MVARRVVLLVAQEVLHRVEPADAPHELALPLRQHLQMLRDRALQIWPAQAAGGEAHDGVLIGEKALGGLAPRRVRRLPEAAERLQALAEARARVVVLAAAC